MISGEGEEKGGQTNYYYFAIVSFKKEGNRSQFLSEQFNHSISAGHG
jgi:hypothetical protein